MVAARCQVHQLGLLMALTALPLNEPGCEVLPVTAHYVEVSILNKLAPSWICC